MQILRCEMTHGCLQPVTHVDDKGFIYCTQHGVARRGHCRCRKLRPHEIRQLARGEALRGYSP